MAAIVDIWCVLGYLPPFLILLRLSQINLVEKMPLFPFGKDVLRLQPILAS